MTFTQTLMAERKDLVKNILNVTEYVGSEDYRALPMVERGSLIRHLVGMVKELGMTQQRIADSKENDAA